MTFPSPFEPPFSFQSSLGTQHGTELDASFDDVATCLNATLANLKLILRDDGALRNQTVHSNSFTSDALALMAGSSVVSSLDWRPMGTWLTATLYRVGNIVETGVPAVAYVCSVQHTSGVFATDYAASKWVVLSSPRTLISADVTGALGFTPVNRAGDTMTGALTLVTGSKLGGASGLTISDALMATQDLLTLNKGLYVAFETTKNAIVYGYAANVVRSAGAFFTVGAQCSAIGTSGAGSTLFGSNFNALGLSGFASALVGQEIDVGSFTPNSTANKYGLNVLFFNRGGANPGEYNYVLPSGTYASAGGGLGSNFYNKNAKAIVVDSAQRSATGEWCGWTRGIAFGEYSLDSETDAAYTASRAYPIGIDFSALHYYGGTDPVTAFNLEAAIALRDFQTIWWNRDPASAATSTSKIKTYFNPATSRWILENGGTERFGIDVVSGDVYKNGAILTGPSLTAANVWSGLNTFNADVTIGANLTFSGNARRIKGDFSNATVANRTIVQTTTANSATEFGVIPSGSGGISALYLLSDSSANNCRVGRISVDATQMQIAAGILGVSGYIPITFGVSGGEYMRLHGSGQLLIAQTAPVLNGAALGVAGIIQCSNPVAFSAHCGGVNFNVANATPTVVNFSTEVFDTNNSFSTANDRFTPPGGTYVLTGAVNSAAAATGAIAASIYKNGVQEKSGNIAELNAGSVVGSTVTCVVQAAAAGTDYFELVVNQVTGGNLSVSGAAADTYFQGWRIG